MQGLHTCFPWHHHVHHSRLSAGILCKQSRDEAFLFVTFFSCKTKPADILSTSWMRLLNSPSVVVRAHSPLFSVRKSPNVVCVHGIIPNSWESDVVCCSKNRKHRCFYSAWYNLCRFYPMYVGISSLVWRQGTTRHLMGYIGILVNCCPEHLKTTRSSSNNISQEQEKQDIRQYYVETAKITVSKKDVNKYIQHLTMLCTKNAVYKKSLLTI